MATGAEVLKTQEQFEMFGGVYNVAYDPCYHMPCDTINNINQYALITVARAAEYTIEVLSFQKNLSQFLNTP